MTSLLSIARVQAQGLKGRDFDVSLDSRVLALGDVGSGKSSIADAIRFAALGCVPVLGRSEAATARLMRGPEMRVRLTLSDGRWCERALVRRGARLSAEARCSWLDEDAQATEVGEAIRSLFGSTDQDAAEMLDLRELLNATPNQRAARIEAILDATGLRVDEQQDWLDVLATARLADLDEARLPADLLKAHHAATGLRATLEDPQSAALDLARSGAEEVLQTKGLADAIAWAGARKREAAEAVRGKTQARKEVEDRVAGLKAPATTLDELAARRQALSDQAAGLAARLDTYRRSLAVRQEAQRAEGVASAYMDGATRDGDPAERASALRKQAADLREQADALTDPDPIPAPEAAEERDDLADALRDLEQQAEALEADALALVEVSPAPPTPEPVPSLEPWRIGVTRAMADAEKVARSPWVEVRVLAVGIDEVAHSLVGKVGTERLHDAAERLVRLSEENGEDPRVAEERVLAARNRLAVEEKRVAEILARNVAAQDLYREHVGAWEDRQKAAAPKVEQARKIRAEVAERRAQEQGRVREENTRRRRAYSDAVAERAAVVDANERKRKALRADADKAERAASDLLARWEKAKAALAEARARLDGLDAVAPLNESETEAEIAGLTIQVGQIDEQRRVLEGADARRRELALLAVELAKAQAERDAYAAVEWACQRIRERDLAARGAGIVGRMETFLRAAGRREQPYLRAAKGKVDFGWSRDGQEIAIEALSGGESVLATTALAAAVVALRGPEVRVLLVEAAEVGIDQSRALLAGLDAVAGDLGNVLVATCLPIPCPDGWEVIRMDATETVEVA